MLRSPKASTASQNWKIRTASRRYPKALKTGGVGFAEYVCSHPCCFYGGRSRLRCQRRFRVVRRVCTQLACGVGLLKMVPLARYSEPELDFVLIALWSILVVFLLLVIVCIECPPPRRLHGD